VYCGAAFPPDWKQGFEEPEGLKWVDRPAVPPDAARKLEMMKVVPLDGPRAGRTLPVVIGLLSLPIFAVLFYLLALMLRRYSPAAAAVVLVLGIAVLGYLAWSLRKIGRR
jgi:hypothetical protein